MSQNSATTDQERDHDRTLILLARFLVYWILLTLPFSCISMAAIEMIGIWPSALININNVHFALGFITSWLLSNASLALAGYLMDPPGQIGDWSYRKWFGQMGIVYVGFALFMESVSLILYLL